MNIKNLIGLFGKSEHRRINHIALPLILNNVSSLIIGLCDQAMVGRTSLAAFGAVGLIATTVNSITGVLGATAVAFNIIGARLKGENNHAQLKNNFALNILLSFTFGMAFFFGALKFGAIILESLYGLKGELLAEASEYLNIFSLSLGLNMILFTFSSYFKIMGRTKYILYGNVIASVANVVFDYVLIFGHFGFPKMGIRGNAVGSILALMLNIAVYMIAVRHDGLVKLKDLKVLKTLKPILKFSFSIMGQELLESTLLVIMINSILSRIGILEVSVYNLLLTVVSIASMPMYSYSQAALTIISEAAGARNSKSVKETPLSCLLFALSFYAVLSTVCIVFKNYIPAVITDDAQLIASSAYYLPMVFISNVFLIPSTVYKYSLQGMEAGNWVFMRSIVINFSGMLLVFVLSEALNLRLYGVYLGMSLNYVALTAAFYLKYKSMAVNVTELQGG